jgi:hypothetical protein
MTKTRHRTFEIFDSADEAKGALASKATISVSQAADPQSRSLRHLNVSHSAGIAHVKFSKKEYPPADRLRDFRDDLAELADGLTNGSRVVLDLEGLREFGAESIAELESFNQKLRVKGSRFVLCNLEQQVQAAFFPKA